MLRPFVFETYYNRGYMHFHIWQKSIHVNKTKQAVIKSEKFFRLEFWNKNHLYNIHLFTDKNPQINLFKTQFEFVWVLNLTDSGLKDDIDLLIDSNYYCSIATRKVKIGKIDEPIAVKTKFRWILLIQTFLKKARVMY